MVSGLAYLPHKMSHSDTTLPTKWQLDPTRLNLNEQEARFFKSLTGIEDDEELKKHIIQVQTKAYGVRSGVRCKKNSSLIMPIDL